MRLMALLMVACLCVACGENLQGKHRPAGRDISFRYELVVPALGEPGDSLDLWIPLPPSNGVQQIHSINITSDLDYVTHTDTVYGNRLIHASGLSTDSSITLILECTITRLEHEGFSREVNVGGDTVATNLKKFLRSNRLVPIDGEIAREATSVVGTDFTTLEKARALYDHLLESMEYDKSGTGWGRGDALYACDVRKGNCTDIHSLFIGMARSLKIPARFIMGFPLSSDQPQGEIAGYHCWAEFYDKDYGWLPVDISEAIKHPEKREFFFGNIDANRIQFTTGRDIPIDNGENSIEMNYLIYPLVLINGKSTEDYQKTFSFVMH